MKRGQSVKIDSNSYAAHCAVHYFPLPALQLFDLLAIQSLEQSHFFVT